MSKELHSCTGVAHKKEFATCLFLFSNLCCFVTACCLSWSWLSARLLNMGMGVGRSCFHFWVKLFVDGMTAFQGCNGNTCRRSSAGLELN